MVPLPQDAPLEVEEGLGTTLGAGAIAKVPLYLPPYLHVQDHLFLPLICSPCRLRPVLLGVNTSLHVEFRNTAGPGSGGSPPLDTRPWRV